MLYKILHQVLRTLYFISMTASLTILAMLSFVATSRLYANYLVRASADSDAPDTGHWYQNPAIVAGLTAITVLVLGKVFDNYQERRKERIKSEESKKAQHQTFTEKVQELQFKDRQEFIDDLKEFHDSKMEFKNEQIRDLKISEFYARERVHAFGNYVNAIQAYTTLIEIELQRLEVKMPYAFAQKSYSEIMHGIDQKVIEFENRLIEEETKRRREREEKEKEL